MTSVNSFSAKQTLRVGREEFEIFAIDAVPGSEKLPFTHKILLENLLRTEDGTNVDADTIRALGAWDARGRAHGGNSIHALARGDAGLHGGTGCG